MTVGKSGTNVGDWVFNSDEKLSEIKLYTDGRALTGIDLRTTKQHFEAFATGGQSTTATTIPSGNGTFVGIFGYAGGHIDSMGIAVQK